MTEATQQTVSDNTAIRPFQVGFTEAELTELRRRVNATRWPERETVADDSQGVPLTLMQELARYRGSDYDWRKCAGKLNDLPQFMTEIDGLDIHFIHVRSQHEDAQPTPGSRSPWRSARACPTSTSSCSAPRSSPGHRGGREIPARPGSLTRQPIPSSPR